jgi:hypothetical protein
VGKCCLGQIKHGVNIGTEGDVPFFIADVFYRVEARLMRGVIDEDVDSAEGASCLVDELRYPLR